MPLSTNRPEASQGIVPKFRADALDPVIFYLCFKLMKCFMRFHAKVLPLHSKSVRNLDRLKLRQPAF